MKIILPLIVLYVLLSTDLYPQKQIYMIGRNALTVLREFGNPYEVNSNMYSYKKPLGTAGAEFVIFEFNRSGYCSSVETIWKYASMSAAKEKYSVFKSELSKTHRTTDEYAHGVTFSKSEDGILTTISLAYEKVGRNWITRLTLTQ